MAVLGVDPGLQRTGYAVLHATGSGPPRVLEAGVIRLSAKQPLAARLVELDACLAELIAAHSPRVLICESLYAHYKHPRTAILMGHARGVILCTAARLEIPVRSVAATHVKKLLTGSGHANKRQMQRAVASTLSLGRLPEPHDTADALAIAYCGLWQTMRQPSLANGRSPRSLG